MEENTLRNDINATPGKPVAQAARQFMKLARTPLFQDNVARIPGGMKGDLQAYAKLFSQGLQWVSEQYPEQPGPKAVLLGYKGRNVEFNKTIIPVVDVGLGRPASGKGDCIVTMPFEEIANTMSSHRKGIGYTFDAVARKNLGTLTARETVFISAVEEAYHAVQFQDPKLLKRYGNAPGTPYGDKAGHDTSPRELDVVPVMERALAEFRQREKSVGRPLNG